MTQADAETTEALDVAAQAASSGAETSAPEPSPAPPASVAGEGSPSVQDYVDDEALDLDGADLPEQTKTEIRKLRREVRGVKDFARTWQSATKGWNESDLDMLREALEAGPNNPDAIGEWFVNSAKALLGDRFAELVGGAPEDVPEVGDPDGEGGTLSAADVERLVNERLEAQDKERRIAERVAEIRRESEAEGFGPTHKLHGALILLARDQTNGDLKAAAELLRAELGQASNTADDSQPGAGGHPQPGAGHTPVATEGGTPAGTQRPTSARAAAEERIQKLIGNARGFTADL